MSILPISAFRTLLNTTITTLNPAVLGRNKSSATDQSDVANVSLSLRQKLLKSKPIAHYQQHTLHYVLKGLGYLPAPLLENMVGYLKGPTSKQYLNANAHLRLIIAVNSKLKTPLQLAQLGGLRKRFAADAVAMQAPKVWQHSAQKANPLPFITKKFVASVSWQDKNIANADGGDMIVRCYQSAFGTKKKRNQNRDEIAMLFFHGGGFCIGDVDTHHEFCHAVCEQTGWAVVSVDYRLAPEHPAPTALRDCIAAYDWLAENCPTLGASSSRIILSGDSAGGCLAALVAQQVVAPSETLWSELGLGGQKTLDMLQNLPHPIAQMPLYPLTDVETNYSSWELYGQGLLLDHDDIVVFDTAYLQHSPLSRQHALVSPMLGNNRQICPTYIVAAELDVLRDEAFAYAEKLQSYGTNVQIHTVLGAPHGFIHFMSVHRELKNETYYIIDDFASFVREAIHAKTVIAA